MLCSARASTDVAGDAARGIAQGRLSRRRQGRGGQSELGARNAVADQEKPEEVLYSFFIIIINIIFFIVF